MIVYPLYAIEDYDKMEIFDSYYIKCNCCIVNS